MGKWAVQEAPKTLDNIFTLCYYILISSSTSSNGQKQPKTTTQPIPETMKGKLTILAIGAMLIMGAPSAIAQITSLELMEVSRNMNNRLVPGQEATISLSEIADLGSTDAKKVQKWLTKYTVADTALKLAYVKYGQQNTSGTIDEYEDHNVKVSARLMDLVKLDQIRHTNFHKKGDRVPIYLYDPNDGTKRPYIVLDYQVGGSGVNALNPESQPKQVATTNQMSQGAGAPQGTGTQQGGGTINIAGTDYVIGIDQNGQQVLVGPNGQLYTGTTNSQQQPSGPANNAPQTASVTQTHSVAVTGDPSLLNNQYGNGTASNGQGGGSSQDAKRWEKTSLAEGEMLVGTTKEGDPYVFAEGQRPLSQKELKWLIQHNYNIKELVPTEATYKVVEARHQSNIVQGVGGGGIMGWYQGAYVTCPNQGFYLSGSNWMCGNTYSAGGYSNNGGAGNGPGGFGAWQCRNGRR